CEMSEDLPEQEIFALIQLLRVDLEICQRKLEEILGPNWTSDLDNIANMSRDRALDAWQQVFEIHRDLGWLNIAAGRTVVSWSKRVGVSAAVFKNSLSQEARTHWEGFVQDLTRTLRATLVAKEKLERQAFGVLAVPAVPVNARQAEAGSAS